MALAATNTTLAGGAAGLSALFLHLWYLERYTGEPYFDVKKAMNGSLAGLVAITGSCGVIEPWAAVVIGLFAGFFYLLASQFLLMIRVDDACDAIPVHGFCGLWGILAVGLFASPTRLETFYGHGNHPGLFYSWSNGNSNAVLLGAQIVGALFIIVWVVVFMLPFFVWLDWKGWLRSDPLEELVGLDTSYHGGLALLANTSDVKPEYISAYKERQAEHSNLRRRQNQRNHDYSGGASNRTSLPKSSAQDDEDEVEDEHPEAFDDKITL